MATRVLSDAFVSIDGTDLSDHLKSVTLTYNAELLDDTAMGDTTRSKKGGLFDWSCSLEFYADEASSNVQQTFFALVGATTALIIRPDKSEGVGATNPNYTCTGIVSGFPLVAGSVGDLQMATIDIQAAGALTRATS